MFTSRIYSIERSTDEQIARLIEFGAPTHLIESSRKPVTVFQGGYSGRNRADVVRRTVRHMTNALTTSEKWYEIIES
jgi:hypothetical protein